MRVSVHPVIKHVKARDVINVRGRKKKGTNVERVLNKHLLKVKRVGRGDFFLYRTSVSVVGKAVIARPSVKAVVDKAQKIV